MKDTVGVYSLGPSRGPCNGYHITHPIQGLEEYKEINPKTYTPVVDAYICNELKSLIEG